MLMSSYHWWFGFPFVMLHVWEWVHYNPWYASKDHCNYWIGEWSSHTQRGFSPFPPPHRKTNGYCHHQRQILNPNRRCHCQSNSYRFGVACFNNDNACNNSCCSRQGMILHRVNTRRWFHSLAIETYDCPHLCLIHFLLLVYMHV
jgi:hypothetical protein